MASIKISDLRSAGSELFFDSESYMSDLADNEFDSVNGGTAAILYYVGAAVVTSSQGCVNNAARVVANAGQIAAGAGQIIRGVFGDN